MIFTVFRIVEVLLRLHDQRNTESYACAKTKAHRSLNYLILQKSVITNDQIVPGVFCCILFYPDKLSLLLKCMLRYKACRQK